MSSTEYRLEEAAAVVQDAARRTGRGDQDTVQMSPVRKELSDFRKREWIVDRAVQEQGAWKAGAAGYM